MRIDDDKELKEAILRLPEKDRTKLLLRLISKNLLLMKQLRHKLLDGEESLEEKRQEVLLEIDNYFYRFIEIIQQNPRYLTPKELLAQMRNISSIVNEHVSVTKDKLADVELRLHILDIGCKISTPILQKLNKRNQTLADYIARRMKFILPRYEKLHPDYQYDLRGRMNEVLLFIHHSAASTVAVDLGLPTNFDS